MSALMWVLELLSDISPELWAAAFLGVFGLLLIVCRDDPRPDDEQADR